MPLPTIHERASLCGLIIISVVKVNFATVSYKDSIGARIQLLKVSI